MANERARALRKSKTSAEVKLWRELRALKPRGYKFRQQAPVDRYIVDFLCLSHRLVIEVDGATHGTQEEIAQDRRREAFLRAQGFFVLRFWNSAVYENTEGVMDMIVATLEDLESSRQWLRRSP
jgi:very-short-patch-repair endonuclease